MVADMGTGAWGIFVLMCVLGVGCGAATGRNTSRRDAIRVAIRRHAPPIEACYEQHRGESGPVTLHTHFVVDEAGTVGLAEVAPGKALPEQARPLAECVLTVIRGIAFRPEPAGGRTEVNYPITFQEAPPPR